jgi:hypothetical protein
MITAPSRSWFVGKTIHRIVFYSSSLPLLDLVGMNIELLGKFGEGLFTANGGESHLRFESRTVIPAGSFGHGSSPVLGKIADLQAEISPNHPVQISRTTSVTQ